MAHLIKCLGTDAHRGFSSDPERVFAVLNGLFRDYGLQHIYSENLEVIVLFWVGIGWGVKLARYWESVGGGRRLFVPYRCWGDGMLQIQDLFGFFVFYIKFG